MIKSKNHRLADQTYQFVNSTVGDIRLNAAHLAGYQTLVVQRSLMMNNEQLTMLSKYFIYERVRSNGETHWMQVVGVKTCSDIEPRYILSFRIIYKLSTWITLDFEVHYHII